MMPLSIISNSGLFWVELQNCCEEIKLEYGGGFVGPNGEVSVRR